MTEKVGETEGSSQKKEVEHRETEGWELRKNACARSCVFIVRGWSDYVCVYLECAWV